MCMDEMIYTGKGVFKEPVAMLRADGNICTGHSPFYQYIGYMDSGGHVYRICNHGKEYVGFFDEKTGDVIDEESFFIPGYEVQLGSMLSSHLSDSMENEEDYEFLFVKDIEPNGNFKVSNAGVTYIYTPYEIGPYSLGTIQVTIPWEEVAPIVAERDQIKPLVKVFH